MMALFRSWFAAKPATVKDLDGIVAGYVGRGETFGDSSRLLHDLRIFGDDACELLDETRERFGIDFVGFVARNCPGGTVRTAPPSWPGLSRPSTRLNFCQLSELARGLPRWLSANPQQAFCKPTNCGVPGKAWMAGTSPAMTETAAQNHPRWQLPLRWFEPQARGGADGATSKVYLPAGPI